MIKSKTIHDFDAIPVTIIGLGRMGQIHLSACKNISGIKIKSLVDKFHEGLSDKNENYNLKYYSNLGDLPRFAQNSLVIISTTSDSRFSITSECIEKGAKKILLEKPAATGLSHLQIIKNLALKNGASIGVNHQMRYMPQYYIPKQLLSSEKYGGFKSMHIAAGNFGMAMNGIHYIEAFRFLSDEKPTAVSAWFDTNAISNPRGTQFQDMSGSIRVTTSSGHRLYIDASADQGHGVQASYMARNGRITIDELTGAMITVLRRPEHMEAPTSRYGMPVKIQHKKIPPVELMDSTKAVLHAFLADDGYPNLADAALAIKTLVAAYHSHRQGGVTVRLADIPDDDPEVFPWA